MTNLIYLARNGKSGHGFKWQQRCGGAAQSEEECFALNVAMQKKEVLHPPFLPSVPGAQGMVSGVVDPSPPRGGGASGGRWIERPCRCADARGVHMPQWLRQRRHVARRKCPHCPHRREAFRVRAGGKLFDATGQMQRTARGHRTNPPPSPKASGQQKTPPCGLRGGKHGKALPMDLGNRADRKAPAISERSTHHQNKSPPFHAVLSPPQPPLPSSPRFQPPPAARCLRASVFKGIGPVGNAGMGAIHSNITDLWQTSKKNK
jgi:hypothetical protein